MPVIYKKGDKIKVTRKIEDCPMGWVDQMDAYVGKEFLIKSVGTRISKSVEIQTGVYLDNGISGGWMFPLEAVEPVLEKYIDGLLMTEEDFAFRTATPRKMTIHEVSVALGFPVIIE